MSISLISQRVFHQTTDISTQVSDFRSGTYALSYTNTQYIYVGATSPFNNIWIEMATPAGSTAGAVTVQVWWGNAWVNAVDIIDGTSGMTASGRISWGIDIDKGWEMEDRSTNVGLTNTNVYYRYWMRLSWANNFSATLGYMGQKFSNDTIFATYYPDLMLADILAGYKTGKTNWDEQHFAASEAVLKDLRKRKIIQDKGQVFDWQTFELAACHRVAQIAYSAFGAPYKDRELSSEAKYNAEMAACMINFDTNKDGHLTGVEETDSSGWVTR